jgi:hypothetical protein
VFAPAGDVTDVVVDGPPSSQAADTSPYRIQRLLPDRRLFIANWFVTQTHARGIGL